jgi:hypothetical protein
MWVQLRIEKHLVENICANKLLNKWFRPDPTGLTEDNLILFKPRWFNLKG